MAEGAETEIWRPLQASLSPRKTSTHRSTFSAEELVLYKKKVYRSYLENNAYICKINSTFFSY